MKAKVLTPLEQAQLTVFEAEATALTAFQEGLKDLNHTHGDAVHEVALGQPHEGSIREAWNTLEQRVNYRRHEVLDAIKYLKSGDLPF